MIFYFNRVIFVIFFKKNRSMNTIRNFYYTLLAKNSYQSYASSFYTPYLYLCYTQSSVSLKSFQSHPFLCPFHYYNTQYYLLKKFLYNFFNYFLFPFLFVLIIVWWKLVIILCGGVNEIIFGLWWCLRGVVDGLGIFGRVIGGISGGEIIFGILGIRGFGGSSSIFPELCYVTSRPISTAFDIMLWPSQSHKLSLTSLYLLLLYTYSLFPSFTLLTSFYL